MKRVAFVMFAAVLFAFSGAATAGQADVDAGFEMGKFFVSANLIAMELEIISAFSDEFMMGDITDENYDAGLITDGDIEGAQLALAYTLWRLQFAIIPMCEGGLEEGALEPEIYGDLAETTALVLTDLLASAEACLAGQDFVAVSVFADDIYEYGFVEDLLWLSDQVEDAAKGGYIAAPPE